MNSDHGGLLKTRAESFARHLQTRLKNLSGSEDNSWTETPSDSEVYYDIDSSLLSPQEEVGEPIFIAAQNLDSLTLQRSDSEASTYFDTVESVDELDLLSSASLKRKTYSLFNLKTESQPKITNGHSCFLGSNEDLCHTGNSSSRLCAGNEALNGHVERQESNGVLNHSSLRLELETIEKELDTIVKETENNCDSLTSGLERNNNNNKSELEEVTELNVGLDLDNEIGETLGEVDTGQLEDDLLVEIAKEPDSEETSLFCDIEQIKPRLPNGCSDCKNLCDGSNIVPSGLNSPSKTNLVLELNVPKEDCGNEHCVVEKERDSQCEQFSNLNHCDKPNEFNDIHFQIGENVISDISDSEESAPISDLLKIIKHEISIAAEEFKENTESTSPKIKEDLSEHPSIEVRGPSPTVGDKANKIEDEEFDIETRRRHFRRSSSLRSGKTPPGTPGRKKIVRFADVLGLDLADVKTFLDEVPTVPKSAYQDLEGVELLSDQVEELLSNSITVVSPQIEKILIPLFQQPCIQLNFLDRVRENNVCLENAIVSDMSLFAVTGVVRVKNIDFHKSVHIRYSINKWQTFSDLQARYVPNSCDGFSDKFSFVLYGHTLSVGQQLEFAVRYHAAGQQFWDSNGGLNYAFVCNSTASSRTFTTIPVTLPVNSDETAAFY